METEIKPLEDTVEVDFDAWPNCSTPDCEFKTTHGSDKCYGCTMGFLSTALDRSRPAISNIPKAFRFALAR